MVCDCWRCAGANGRGKSNKNAAEDQEFANREPSKPTSDASSALETKDAAGNLSSEVDNVTRNAATKTRQKLYWGYFFGLSFTDCLSIFMHHNVND